MDGATDGNSRALFILESINYTQTDRSGKTDMLYVM